MQVILTPETGEIHVKDTLQFEQPTKDWQFTLNKGLRLDIAATPIDESHPWLTTYRWQSAVPVTRLELSYQGKLTLFEAQANDMPLGYLNDSGAYLDSSVA